jgi:long-chain acyl-CoA synthetase
VLSLVFTSGTTGVPKGVMQTHASMIVPVDRFAAAFAIREHPRFLSYLPLSHIGERQLVEGFSLLTRGTVTFNESLATLLRDLPDVRPNFVFGPPRIWEQLQQTVIAKFGSQPALDRALAEDAAAVRARVDAILGLGDSDYCLTAAAPTPPALIEWFRRVGVQLLEGYGQTEAMGLVAGTRGDFRVGSIGKPLAGVEMKLSAEDELMIRAEGLSPGYYEMPDKTAELYRDGWLHTGDKARVDDDGFVYLTGRVKDYFKTIQGKFVAPVPIESDFADNPHTAQVCLLGRGYSKTVMVCVLNESGQRSDRDEVERALRAKAGAINAQVEKHARIGALILCHEAWTIENEVLTPTLKIRRERVEARFGDRAEPLARVSAEQSTLLIEWTWG